MVGARASMGFAKYFDARTFNEQPPLHPEPPNVIRPPVNTIYVCEIPEAQCVRERPARCAPVIRERSSPEVGHTRAPTN